MLHFYTTDNATQNQDVYDSFIKSILPLLASVPCPKCGMIGMLILYGTYSRNFINTDMIRTIIQVQRVQCTNCGSTHSILPTTVLPYFLHIVLNIQNAVDSNPDSEMCITYRDYLKRRFRHTSLHSFPSFFRFFLTIHSILKNRRIFFGFVI